GVRPPSEEELLLGGVEVDVLLRPRPDLLAVSLVEHPLDGGHLLLVVIAGSQEPLLKVVAGPGHLSALPGCGLSTLQPALPKLRAPKVGQAALCPTFLDPSYAAGVG